MKKILNFPKGEGQAEDGWCGPNLMRQIILYKTSLYVPEKNLVNIGCCSIKGGTNIKNMGKIATTFGLVYYTKNNSSIDDLIHSIDNGNPAVLLIQAWPFKKIVDWTNSWDNGHYIGVFGYDNKKSKLFYYDPCGGKIKDINYKSLEERWHDINFKTGEIYHNFGMFFKN
ncbi:MAG: C39 family peptidase [Candidatus Gastranaerophilales bacterium]|nr:C39 family peptidase [Candidatus Gastranaerophilales bacterium]